MSATLLLEGGNPKAYTIGAYRFWFNRKSDDTTTPKKYEGYRDWGNVKEAPQEPEIDEKDHYSARMGERVKDASLMQVVGEDIVLTLDEWTVENMRNLLYAGDVTDVSQSTTAVTNEIVQLRTTEVAIISGYNPTSIVVKSFDDADTYVLDTDYEIVDIAGGYKGIRRISTSEDIASGDFVRVNYTKTIRAHKKMAPNTALDVEGKAMLFGVSKRGVESIRQWDRVILRREGGFGLNSEDWSTFQIRVKVLDNSAVSTSFPWGVMEYYGINSKIYSGS